MLLQNVIVKVAQERLGHKDIVTTMNVCSHVLPSAAKEASDKIGEFLCGGVGACGVTAKRSRYGRRFGAVGRRAVSQTR